VFRDRFTKTVLKSLNFDVNMFWDKRWSTTPTA
jgi:hypothetical protein